VEKRDPTLAAV